MTISFTSTYRVPFKQPKSGVSPGQKDALKAIANQFGGIVPTYREGNVKFSARKKFDKQIMNQLSRFGFHDYERVELHNVPNAQIVDALTYQGRFVKFNPKNIQQDAQ